MELKLTRADLVNGEIYFRVYHGTECIKSFYATNETEAASEEVKAKVFLQACIERIKEGYPKEETIESVNI